MDQLRLAVHTPAGVFKHHRSTNVSDLERFLVAGDGNCLEASFQAKASELGITPRDIVTLDLGALIATGTFDENGNMIFTVAWDTRFRGVAVQSGTRRSLALSDFKLVGLKKRFYELPTLGYSFAGMDVAQQVAAILAYTDPETGEGNVPAGVTVGALSTIGFETGELKPNLNKLGEVLDALAKMCPGFTVPAGESYTYSGETYYEGEEVPPVTWGVDAEGAFFFHRKSSRLTVSETAPDTRLEWVEVDSEKLVTQVRFYFGMTTEEGVIEACRTGIEQPKAYVVTHPTAAALLGRAEETVPVVGEGIMIEASPIGWSLHTGSVISGTLADLIDPDSSTAVMLKADGNGHIGLKASIPAGTVTDGILIDRDDGLLTSYAFVPSGSVVTFIYGGPHPMNMEEPAIERNGKIYYNQPTALDEVSPNIVYDSGPPAEWQGADLYLFFRTVPNAEHTFRKLYLFTLNRRLLPQLAESYFQIPADDPALVDVPGWGVTPAPFVDLTLESSEVLARPLEAIEYRATKQAGFRARLRVGQRAPADAAALRDIIRDETKAAIKLQAINYQNDHYVSQYRRPAQLAPAEGPGNTIPPSDDPPIPPPDETPPVLSATGADEAVALSWSAVNHPHVTGYEIYRGLASGALSLLTSVGVVTEHYDTGLTNGTTYYYQVRAIYPDRFGGWSNEASATPAQPGFVTYAVRLWALSNFGYTSTNLAELWVGETSAGPRHQPLYYTRAGAPNSQQTDGQLTDDDYHTYVWEFENPSEGPVWWQLDFAEEVHVGHYKIMCGLLVTGGAAIQTWKLEYWDNDLSQWIEADTGSVLQEEDIKGVYVSTDL